MIYLTHYRAVGINTLLNFDNQYKEKNMNKAELIESITEGTELTKADATKFLEAYVGTITKTLQSGEQIVMPGFGTFSVSNRAARMGRNPRTGESIEIKASRVPKFKAGKGLKDALAE